MNELPCGHLPGYCACPKPVTDMNVLAMQRVNRMRRTLPWMTPAGCSINHPRAQDGISSRAARQEPLATT